MDNERNNGLQQVYESLNTYYSQMTTTENFTRADFWNVFSVEALNRANVSPNFVKVHTVGRIDCATSPHEDIIVEFPNARLGWSHVLEQFGPSSEYGNSAREVVALIAGGHSLGKARLSNSGFEHAWDRCEDRAGNSFLRHMQNDMYQSVQNGAGNHQWNLETGGDTLLALNTDLVIAKTFEFD